MANYNPCSKEFQEEAKRLGLTGSQYIKKLREEGKLVNTTEVRREADNKKAQKKGYRDIREYSHKLYHREDYIPVYKHNPCSKEFQEEAKKLGLTGFQYVQKLIKEGKLLNPTSIGRKKNQKLFEESDCKNSSEYRDKCKQKLGYENYNEYQRELSWNKGLKSPMSENDNCTSYLGVTIGEESADKILIELFGTIEKKMPYGNIGYDHIVKGGYKIDIKTSVLDNERNRFVFDIYHNKIATHFLLIAFDNRDNLSIMHIWLIKAEDIVRGRKLNLFSCLTIVNDDMYMRNFKQYDHINKLKCLKDIQDKLKEI